MLVSHVYYNVILVFLLWVCFSFSVSVRLRCFRWCGVVSGKQNITLREFERILTNSSTLIY
jgi:uncharacterized membrane protein YjjB (DUF3815 family)